jgi:hypothetical protein
VENNGFEGNLTSQSATSDFSTLAFVINSLLGEISTATLVQVIGVTQAGTLDPVGFVDILPLVNQWDGNNVSVPHGTLYNCAYFRLQGGTDAIIMDPKIGDIGIAVFADHDISTVQITKKQANPGSHSRFSMADGLYIGGVLNGVPTQYIQYNAAGITLYSPTKVFITAPDVAITGDTVFTGKVTANGKRIDESHTHTGVQTGTDNTGQVT